ncbi:hypothetical protein SAZ10_23385 [Mesorhizobium sp. BAC0120]|nr:hypothetical protein [Mesorhizobium sp. BAC0120]MDW6024703.1 hypothetical protein [Mesorhizobium sp. BAC0120]
MEDSFLEHRAENGAAAFDKSDAEIERSSGVTTQFEHTPLSRMEQRAIGI